MASDRKLIVDEMHPSLNIFKFVMSDIYLGLILIYLDGSFRRCHEDSSPLETYISQCLG